jgi:hypothetical protein
MDGQDIGLLALCGSMLGVLSWIIKEQTKTIRNHLIHIQSILDRLPCRSKDKCPEKKP